MRQKHHKGEPTGTPQRKRKNGKPSGVTQEQLGNTRSNPEKKEAEKGMEVGKGKRSRTAVYTPPQLDPKWQP